MSNLFPSEAHLSKPWRVIVERDLPKEELITRQQAFDIAVIGLLYRLQVVSNIKRV